MALSAGVVVLFDQVSETQMRAGQMLGGATMVAFLAAPMFRHQAWAIRLVITCLYIACVLGFLLYFLV